MDQLSAMLPPLEVGSTRGRLIPRRFGALTDIEIPLQGSLRIGRFDPTSGPVDIDLSQFPGAEHVSRHHATISQNSNGVWQVSDAGSANGVYVKQNGSATFAPRLSAAHTLADGDEIAFGNIVMVFRAS
jgi:pSer/pThr/pTyr-binding forkhead associated (FHA) protein